MHLFKQCYYARNCVSLLWLLQIETCDWLWIHTHTQYNPYNCPDHVEMGSHLAIKRPGKNFQAIANYFRVRALVRNYETSMRVKAFRCVRCVRRCRSGWCQKEHSAILVTMFDVKAQYSTVSVKN